MKKMMCLLLILLSVVFVLPFSVLADGEDVEGEARAMSNEVPVYFFHGDGCPHCAEAEEFFESIEEELGSKFEVQPYEVWYDEANSDLMAQVAAARGEEDEATGVPYIIIGDKSWIGFDAKYEDEIKEAINKLDEQDPAERYDIMTLLPELATGAKKEKTTGTDIVSLLIILVVVGGIGAGVYFARKNN